MGLHKDQADINGPKVKTNRGLTFTDDMQTALGAPGRQFNIVLRCWGSQETADVVLRRGADRTGEEIHRSSVAGQVVNLPHGKYGAVFHVNQTPEELGMDLGDKATIWWEAGQNARPLPGEQLGAVTLQIVNENQLPPDVPAEGTDSNLVPGRPPAATLKAIEDAYKALGEQIQRL